MEQRPAAATPGQFLVGGLPFARVAVPDDDRSPFLAGPRRHAAARRAGSCTATVPTSGTGGRHRIRCRYGYLPRPDGYGFFNFITAGSAISPAGNYNVAQLNDPVVNGLLQKMAVTNNATTRNSYTARTDMQVMKDAAIPPEVYAKSLLYRGPNLTNVFVQGYYGMYNYSTLGLK